MKLLVVLSVAVVGTFATSKTDAIKKCIGEFRIDPASIPIIMSKGPTNDEEECFLHCSLKEMDMIDDEGNFNVENAKKQVEELKDLPDDHKQAAMSMIEQCSKVKCSGKCKCGPAALNCLKEKFGDNVCSAMLGQ